MLLLAPPRMDGRKPGRRTPLQLMAGWSCCFSASAGMNPKMLKKPPCGVLLLFSPSREEWRIVFPNTGENVVEKKGLVSLPKSGRADQGE